MSFVLAEKIPPFLRGRLGLTLFALAGICATFTVAFALRRAAVIADAQEFERRQNLRQAFLQQSLLEYENSLFALRLVAENNLTFEPAEFDRAARDIHARSPGIESIQWAPIVPAAEAADFLTRARALSDPAFVIRQRGQDGGLREFDPSVQKSSEPLAVITYLYPRGDAEAPLGYDIYTAPTSLELHRAHRTLDLTLTRPLRLVQGFDGVVFTCYTRRPPGPQGPPLAGPGYVQLVLHLRRMLQNLWNLSPSTIADFSLYDITEPEPIPLYTHLANRDLGEPEPMPYAEFAADGVLCRELVIGGRIWRACYRPGAEWVAGRRDHGIFFVIGGGLLLTALGTVYLRLLLREQERVQRQVAERTAELSESRAFLDAVIRQSPSNIWVKDGQLRFRLVNAEFCRTYERDASELIGRTDSVLYSPEMVAQMEKTDREVLATGETRHFETTYPIGDRLRTYLVAKFPLHAPDGRIDAVAGVATDITESRRAELERAAIERRLLETKKLESRGVLAGGIAHDFNNLLTGVLGHASLCRAVLPADSETQTSLIQIEQAARRAAEICQQMLAFAGRGRFAVEPVELGALVRDTLPLLRLSVSNRARFHFDLAAGLPAVEADRTQLRQLVMNLVMNASDAFGDREGDITVRTRLVAGSPALFASCVHTPDLPAGDYVCIEIADNGSGMTPDMLHRIFDPFYTTKFTGRGLGLAAVLGIAIGHGGAIRVVSEPGRGSAFFVYLPPAPATNRAPLPIYEARSEKTAPPSPPPAPPAPATSAAEPAPAPPIQPAAGRLLLVDDEESVRETAAAILGTFGHETDTAPDGDTALARLRADPARYQAAIMDLTMPGLSGAALLAALRGLRADLPILLMSGYSELDAAELLTAPRTAFIAKPFTVAALRESLAALLRDHR